MTLSAIVDSSYLVALVDDKDSLHSQATQMVGALENHSVRLVFLDILMGESISVLARRCAERKHGAALERTLEKLTALVPEDSITWVGQEIRRHYSSVLADVQLSRGGRNFNDALTVIVAQVLAIPAIISFDSDFDNLPGLTRLSDQASVRSLAGQ